MRTTFLDYYKMILDKVSFDSNLFKKEYQKAIKSLPNHQVSDLNNWLKSKGFQFVPLKQKSGNLNREQVTLR